MLRRAVIAGFLALVAVTLVLAFRIDDALELPARDAALRLLPPHPAQSTVVVAIDERSLREIGPWPWTRTKLAAIVNRAADAGARAVILDLLLAETGEGDEDLARALRRLPSIAVSVLDEHRQWLAPVPVIRAATTAAHGNFELDHDGILRRLASTKQSRTSALTAVSVEAASIVTSRPVPVGVSIAPMFRTRPKDIPRASGAAVVLDRRSPGEDARRSTLLRNKLVFIGPTAFGLGDRVLTPVSAHVPDPGVTVHAAATESLIRGEEVHELPPVLAGLVAALLVASILLFEPRRSGTIALLIVIAGGIALLATTGYAIPFVILLACIVLTVLAREAVRLMSTITGLNARRAEEAESKRILAHELKTPVASMRGLSQLLAGFELSDDERRRVASLLENEAGKLQSMVTGLLDLERLPLRVFEASSSVINLGDAVAARIDFLRASTDRTIMMSATPGVFVRGDAALIERVVDNLVSNAIKYTPEPSPVIVTVGRSGGEALLEVEDRGPGIASADRQRIFDRFFRGGTARGTQGLGLGLSLVAEVTRWHGGTVSVHDAAAGGALFRVALPLAPAAAKAGAM